MIPKPFCSKFIKDFGGSDFIVTPSASCAGLYQELLSEIIADNSSHHNDVKDLQKRVYEFSDFLVNILRIEDLGASLPVKATYHDSCAALRECRIKEEPRKLLRRVKGLELTEMAEVETCCGFGGTFSVKFGAISTAMADQKIKNALLTGAGYIISTDLSCLMHIDACIREKALGIKTMHIADVLASGW